MQNRAGRSSLADQNTLFSEFSPFTRGEREAASLGPPHRQAPRRPEHNTNLTSRAVRRDIRLFKKTRENKQVTDVMEDTHKWLGDIKSWLECNVVEFRLLIQEAGTLSLHTKKPFRCEDNLSIRTYINDLLYICVYIPQDNWWSVCKILLHSYGRFSK